MHQIICGDDKGSFSLLSSSYTDSTIPLRLASSSDLIDRPPDGVLESPVIRGFWKENYFMLIKTFPDTNEGIRKGRVFSHAIILEEKDLLEIKDITKLLAFHVDSIDKSFKPQVIHYKNKPKDKLTIAEDKRISFAINGLVNHHENQNTVVWIGEDNYMNWVSQIWNTIPIDVKKSLKIGVVFDPNKIDRNLLNLVYTPDSIKSNWTNTEFKIVDLNSSGNLKKQTAYYLAGNQDKCQSLLRLLTDFSITPKDIDDILQFEKLIGTYEGIDTTSSLKQLIIFADLVSKYTRNTQSSLPFKNKLLNAVIGKIDDASIAEISMLTNPNWSGFKNAEKKISDSLNTCLEKILFDENNNKDTPLLINKAFKETKHTWWSIPIKKQISSSLKSWKKAFAKPFWDWVINEPDMMDELGLLLPSNAEKDLVTSLPKLKKTTEKKVLEFAYNSKWIVLHGVLVVKNHSINEALSKQLNIDNNPIDFDALRAMASNSTAEKFVIESINFEDDRLLTISAEICSKKPKILATNIVLDDSRWLQLWSECIDQGNEIWDGFSNPTKTLHKILNIVIEEEVFDNDLLLKISTSTNNDLTGYPRRNEIWSILRGQTKSNFLTRTALSCLALLSNGKISFDELEPPLKEEIQKDQIILQFLRASSIEVSLKTLRMLPHVDKKPVTSFIDNNRFNQLEAITLGEIVKLHHWKPIASYIYNNIAWRHDLKLTLQQCAELLSSFQRLGLTLSGILTNSISNDEWWEIFTNQAIKLYPKGADQNGIWSNAGGHDSDLPQKTTGKEVWNHAITIIRNGGTPQASVLIDKMLEEFPHDEILKKLRQTL
ncbi:GAP1-N1 domain-containing protein [Seonamhaeicola marinus]|uniref:Effector-associated domain-containing protein n=1 Tax=Seonamhaeicola marinus TaxID=1912246 RepID=A0A5D0HZJ9_9FLAO|nr:effector-associated domain EAD1-containing protein [Seonamhaeicola marinus]TYA74932.1 hypothetical protein FUA24_16665 [Seonamhaeicola marinus]